MDDEDIGRFRQFQQRENESVVSRSSSTMSSSEGAFPPPSILSASSETPESTYHLHRQHQRRQRTPSDDFAASSPDAFSGDVGIVSSSSALRAETVASYVNSVATNANQHLFPSSTTASYISSLPPRLSISHRADSESTDEENYVSVIQKRIGAARPAPATSWPVPHRFSGSEFTSEAGTSSCEEPEEEMDDNADTADNQLASTPVRSNVVVTQLENIVAVAANDFDSNSESGSLSERERERSPPVFGGRSLQS